MPNQMNADVQLNLALILFLPWFLILGALYWIYPRAPRSPRRSAFDILALATSTLAAGAGHCGGGIYNADPHYGAMWAQIVATSVSYGPVPAGDDRRDPRAPPVDHRARARKERSHENPRHRGLPGPDPLQPRRRPVLHAQRRRQGSTAPSTH
jgi:hypothetical protein